MSQFAGEDTPFGTMGAGGGLLRCPSVRVPQRLVALRSRTHVPPRLCVLW